MASLNFKGKSAVWNHHLSVPYHTLDKDKASSLAGEDEHENLIIEGDNLLALKALLPKYQGKIKCIYIDPPYNTGNEGWVYSDNVNNPIIKDWLGKTVGREGEDLTRHDKWLCMMTPRLKLLRELLTEDGVMFVSIDENEVHNLRTVMNEIFSGQNNVEEMVWKKVENDSGKLKITHRFRIEHEYILVGYKNKESTRFTKYLSERNYKNQYTNPDKDPRGEYKQGIISTTEEKSKTNGKNYYEVLTPSGKIYKRQWRMSENELKELMADKRIYFGKKGDSVPSLKVFINELGETTPMSILEGFGTAKSAGMELQDLFGGIKTFDYPKPVNLIKNLIQICTKGDDIILDSFAGSGTTAQAVIEMNKEDGIIGKRKFILVQIAEEIKEKNSNGLKNPTFEAGYRWVHEITRDRVKKVIKKDKLDIGFTYYKLGPSIDGKNILEGKDLPTWDIFAKYVHYLATGNPVDEVKKPNATWEIISKEKHTGIYLIYKDNIDDLKKLAITRDWLEILKNNKETRKIVYAPACFLDKEVLDEYNISFVQIPFNLFQRK